jgi:uncharacterized protein YlzI (FlbEa/FlbD family)
MVTVIVLLVLLMALCSGGFIYTSKSHSVIVKLLTNQKQVKTVEEKLNLTKEPDVEWKNFKQEEIKACFWGEVYRPTALELKLLDLSVGLQTKKIEKFLFAYFRDAYLRLDIGDVILDPFRIIKIDDMLFLYKDSIHERMDQIELEKRRAKDAGSKSSIDVLFSDLKYNPELIIFLNNSGKYIIEKNIKEEKDRINNLTKKKGGKVDGKKLV